MVIFFRLFLSYITCIIIIVLAFDISISFFSAFFPLFPFALHLAKKGAGRGGGGSMPPQLLHHKQCRSVCRDMEISGNYGAPKYKRI